LDALSGKLIFKETSQAFVFSYRYTPRLKEKFKKPSPTGPQRTKPKSPNLKTIPELKKIMKEKAKTLTKLPLKDFLQSTRRVRI